MRILAHTPTPHSNFTCAPLPTVPSGTAYQIHEWTTIFKAMLATDAPHSLRCVSGIGRVGQSKSDPIAYKNLRVSTFPMCAAQAHLSYPYPTRNFPPFRSEGKIPLHPQGATKSARGEVQNMQAQEEELRAQVEQLQEQVRRLEQLVHHAIQDVVYLRGQVTALRSKVNLRPATREEAIEWIAEIANQAVQLRR